MRFVRWLTMRYLVQAQTHCNHRLTSFGWRNFIKLVFHCVIYVYHSNSRSSSATILFDSPVNRSPLASIDFHKTVLAIFIQPPISVFVLYAIYPIWCLTMHYGPSSVSVLREIKSIIFISSPWYFFLFLMFIFAYVDNPVSGTLKPSNGHNHILTVVGRFKRWAMPVSIFESHRRTSHEPWCNTGFPFRRPEQSP